MNHHQLTTKKFTFLNFSEDESFDKVESSTGNNSNRLPIIMKSREVSECNTNSIPLQILKVKPQYGSSVTKSIYPMQGKPQWNIQCSNCDKKLDKIGETIGLYNLMDEVKNIYILRKGSEFQYGVQYSDSRILKFESKVLAIRHPKQMVKFLQKQAF